MKVLSEMPTGMGSKWILAKFSNDFYGYGTEMDFKSAWGLPVNQCGTKTEVLENCLRMQKVNLDFIDEYNKELLKENIFGGKDLSHDFPELGQCALYCVSEITTLEEMEHLRDALKRIVKGE